MENSSASFYFNLTMFVNIGHYRYPAFVFCLLLYSFMISANLVIILVVSRERTLHEPMYIFVALLSVNSLYGSTGFFPRFLSDLLVDVHLMSRPECFTQIYVFYTYVSFEMTILGIIAYDRHVAVCSPLHYHTKMTRKTVVLLAASACILPLFTIALGLFLTVRLPLCGNKIQRVLCGNWNIVKLSCVSTIGNNIYGIFLTVTIFFPLLYVLYTYVQIVAVCWKGAAEFRRKVFQNCLPHVISFVLNSLTIVCDVAFSRYNIEEINPFLAVILSLEFILIPPVLNPLVYGLKLPQIRREIFRLFAKHKLGRLS
uniref:Olfactory receptor n=1 Tax=Tetraodon nigroviridis TaxID=99883 RepID=Q2PR74_TETNG|nr:odorant receptor [Tetraodon nigroviridis]ABC43393.1 odorant receptor [Tetraodon nigroviridis]